MKAQFEYATQEDLATITAIYNQIIPSRLATADLEPVTVASKQAWFDAFNHEQRPIWKIMLDGKIAGWVSVEYFYGRRLIFIPLKLVFISTKMRVIRVLVSNRLILSLAN